MRRLTLTLVLILAAVLTGACVANVPAAAAVDTVTPTTTMAPTRPPLPTATDTPVPTDTPTPAPLQPAQIFDKVAPAVAYVETETSRGSGLLVEGGYVVTNAHVVWPYQAVRVVFSDGSEYEDAAVLDWDLLGDLAVIGPIETDIPPQPMIDGETSAVGSDVYLIGYPGEVEDYPQPTISRGLISRLRQWERIGMTYFQTDAAIAGGQSGGVFVSERGEVIGISGFTFADREFGLAASSADIWPRVEQMIAGDDVDGLSDLWSNLEEPEENFTITLLNKWDAEVFMLEADMGTEIEIDLESAYDNAIFMSDDWGRTVAIADAVTSGREQLRYKTEKDIPYFVIVAHKDTWNSHSVLESNVPLRRFKDAQDGVPRFSIGHSLFGSIDYPGDMDVFRMNLNKGDVINVQVESVLIDPMIRIDMMRADSFDDAPRDDDSGGGVFGTDAELSFEAPKSGLYGILVFDGSGFDVGGYYLRIDKPDEGAPTPVVVKPTPTPIRTELGDMVRFESKHSPQFSLHYPATWNRQLTGSNPLTDACINGALACMYDPDETTLLVLLEEPLNQARLGKMTQQQYVSMNMRIIEAQSDQLAIVRREDIENPNGYELTLVEMEQTELGLHMWQLFHLADDVGFRALYFFIDYNVLLEAESGELDEIQQAIVETLLQNPRRPDLEKMQTIVDTAVQTFDILDD